MVEDDIKPAPIGAQWPTATQERRAALRRRILKSGAIEFGSEAIPCTVRSLSAEGAGIEVNSPLWFPDRFVLAVEGERRASRIVWKKGKRLGLAFV
ncbi:PilZ domain-containing protein [Bradyrhizobium sp. ISRA443]|uniref:PilZ domain-containing protein n=1 Tax=unclassified Bradyrhizobium TaxID=2631580 RepID=UPI0024788ED2|nr:MULTISPECIES: PilZ domain-containing protein [unclassified Bradyrhizobium]WGS01811.1 PilZ domain-containing protein [Bradyrhizobium sp. ISRA436]WGS08697.1 PilZ domain-containing protein [Bradyrhizobium sp. ISRA437]WGS15585.1 PilZ domain-containing protein [Bradyrhizobium sp. ISRA443]